jgi:hypothetical protein
MGVRTLLETSQRVRYEFLKEEIREYIHKGIEAFERVAADMLEIRDQRLYREEYDTFEEFCRETLGRSKTQVNRMIQAGDVIKGLMAQGETVLPDNSRIAYEMALYPPRDRKLIWKRARQIADRNNEKPTYKTIRDAALDIVPTQQTKERWTKDLLRRLATARRALKMSPDFSILGLDSMLKIVFELVKIRQAVDEIQMLAENRAAHLQREAKVRGKQ